MINRPIRTEAEYKAALAEIEPYFAREPEADLTEADRFDLLTLLIEAYEERHHPIGPPHPIEMIRHRMRTAGYTQADLGELSRFTRTRLRGAGQETTADAADDLEAEPAMENSRRGAGGALPAGG